MGFCVFEWDSVWVHNVIENWLLRLVRGRKLRNIWLISWIAVESPSHAWVLETNSSARSNATLSRALENETAIKERMAGRNMNCACRIRTQSCVYLELSTVPDCPWIVVVCDRYSWWRGRNHGQSGRVLAGRWPVSRRLASEIRRKTRKRGRPVSSDTHENMSRWRQVGGLLSFS